MLRTHAALLGAFGMICLSVSRCALPVSPSESVGASIVAYNVKSLFDSRDDGAEFPEYSVAKGKWDDARYKIRLANTAQAVLAACPGSGMRPGPDILCLEEIENAHVLEDLRSGPLSKSRYGYVAIAPAEGGPFSVGVLSRLPIVASTCHSASTPAGRAGRDILELDIDAAGTRLVLLGCHWKSKSEGAQETEEARREEAALVRDLVAARITADPDVELVVCGDFNESPDEFLRVERRYPTALMPIGELAASVAPRTRSRAASRSPVARLLVTAEPTETVTDGSEPVLYSPWEASGGYSYSFRGSRERLDGFLLSPGLLDGSGLAFKSFAAATAPFLVDRSGDPLAWPGSGTTGYSDHLPIVLGLAAGP